VARWYGKALIQILNAEVDLDDGMVWTLHSSSYAINPDTDDYVNDLTNELPTASGYTAGGIAAGVGARTYTAANAWAVSRANTTAYVVDDVVRPAVANGFLYRCAVAGTSGGSPPAFSTVLGRETADGGTVVWETVGRGIFMINFADPVWGGASFTARYAVLSDRTAGAASAQPLVGYVDFGSDKTGLGGNFTIQQHPNLRTLHAFVP